MNPQVLLWMLKAGAAIAQIKSSGLTDKLTSEIGALNQELRSSILAPKADGSEWTDADIQALVDQHYQLTNAIRLRHQAPGV